AGRGPPGGHGAHRVARGVQRAAERVRPQGCQGPRRQAAVGAAAAGGRARAQVGHLLWVAAAGALGGLVARPVARRPGGGGAAPRRAVLGRPAAAPVVHIMSTTKEADPEKTHVALMAALMHFEGVVNADFVTHSADALVPQPAIGIDVGKLASAACTVRLTSQKKTT
ncbi:unnamed protein product, partial [Prorocentrum cordatum]